MQSYRRSIKKGVTKITDIARLLFTQAISIPHIATKFIIDKHRKNASNYTDIMAQILEILTKPLHLKRDLFRFELMIWFNKYLGEIKADGVNGSSIDKTKIKKEKYE